MKGIKEGLTEEAILALVEEGRKKEEEEKERLRQAEELAKAPPLQQQQAQQQQQQQNQAGSVGIVEKTVQSFAAQYASAIQAPVSSGRGGKGGRGKGSGKDRKAQSVVSASQGTGEPNAKKRRVLGSVPSSSGPSASIAIPAASGSSVDDTASVGTRGKKTKKKEEQTEKYSNMDPCHALSGDAMKGPLYQAGRAQLVMQNDGQEGTSEYVALVGRIRLVEKCVDAWSSLPGLATPVRRALLEELNGVIDDFPYAFQEKVLYAEVRDLKLESHTDCERWLDMVLPSEPASGADLCWR